MYDQVDVRASYTRLGRESLLPLSHSSSSSDASARRESREVAVEFTLEVNRPSDIEIARSLGD